ncbi:MAG: calcium-binding EGF-like domain-containing protein [Myxococcota bacterium]|nr:calcium-binding EGF-like domain-containing protein [Myxococcota bacterium]
MRVGRRRETRADFFPGARGETDIDDCAGHGCQQDSPCVDGVGSCTCDCAPGFSGDRGETEIDECDPEPCLHGGAGRSPWMQYTRRCVRNC